MAEFNKRFCYYGVATDVYDVVKEVTKAFQTDNWRPALVKIETVTAGKVVVAGVSFSFSAIAGAPVGIFGFGVLIALTSSLIDDSLINKINTRLDL